MSGYPRQLANSVANFIADVGRSCGSSLSAEANNILSLCGPPWFFWMASTTAGKWVSRSSWWV